MRRKITPFSRRRRKCFTADAALRAYSQTIPEICTAMNIYIIIIIIIIVGG
jgi:hypothetical protein